MEASKVRAGGICIPGLQRVSGCFFNPASVEVQGETVESLSDKSKPSPAFIARCSTTGITVLASRVELMEEQLDNWGDQLTVGDSFH